MADAGSFEAELGVNLQFNVDGAALVEMTKTIKEISKGKDLQRYWKDIETATDNAGKAIERYRKNISSQNLAENFLKQVNALKAISKSENLSELFPNIDVNFDELIESAKKLVPRINSEFSVDNFEQAFKTFDLLKDKGIELGEVFSKLADYASVVKRNLELDKENHEFKNLLGDTDIEKLKRDLGEIQNLRNQAEKEFDSFLNVNKIERTDFWGDERFSEYFSEIKNGSMTATDAIARFKTEYSYLLEESFKSNNDTFGLEQLNLFSNKLDSIFRQVEETSNKINDIISNGVITKSIENLSVDNNLSDQQRSIFGNLLEDEESLKSITSLFQKLIEESNQTKNTELFDEEQFNRLLILFEKIESSLSSMKAVFVDVGDGEEFSPLLKMIDNVQSSIKELSTSVSGIKLDVNMDLGSEVNERLNQKVSQSMNRQLEAYRNLYSAMKASKKTNKEMLRFYEPEDASISEIIGAYKGVIKRAEDQYGKDVYKKLIGKETYNSYLKEIKNATEQFNRATNKKNTDNPLGDLFGKNELIEVVSQLGLIADKLSEISSTVSGLGDTFENVFKDGFNVSASIEEIEKLTNRVKELEDELSKVKINPAVDGNKSNISSDNGIVKELENVSTKEDEVIAKTQVMYRAFNSSNGISGKGISWFSDELETAESYIESRGKDRIARLVTDTSKFLTIDANGSSFNKILYGGIERTTDELAEMAKQAGYAGIAINNVYDSFSASTDIKPSSIFAIFDENIVKKATDVTETIKVEESVININSLISETNEKLELEKANQKELNALLDDYNNGRKISAEDKDYIEDGTLQKSLERSIKESEAYERKLESLNVELAKLYANQTSATPIEDVFQNEKVEQATTSAKELDKTLEQVNIPKDSFDDVLSKLDLVKSELKDIVKITKQSVSDAEGKFHDSYTLKDSRGSTEIYGLSSNTEKGQLLRSNIVQYDVKDEEQEAKEIQKAWDDAEKAITEYLKAKTKLNTLEATDIKSGNVKNNIDAQKQKVEELEVEAENARKVLSNLLGSQDIDTTTWNNFLKLMKDFEEAGKGSSQSIAKIKDVIANVNTSELQTIDKYIESAQKKLDSTKSSRNNNEKSSFFQTYEKDVQECINAIIAERNRLENAVKSGDIEIIDEESLSNLNKLKQKLEETNSGFKTMFKGSAEISRWKEIDTITKYMEKNTRISKEAKDKLREYIETLKTNGADADVEEIHKAFLRVCDGERKAKREGQSFLDVLRDKVWYQWAAQIGSYFSLNDIMNYAKEGIQTVRELDTALTEMRKVSDESASSLKRVQDASFDLANEVGTTALQIQNSIADFMRIGDSVEEAQKHALDANTLLQVSEFDNIEDATSALVSMSKAWDDIDTKHINDVLNILGNNMPIATDELASSLQRSAGTLATLGATIEEAAALTVAGNSILQDPDSVAAGLRTIDLRMVGTTTAKEELQSLGEDVDDFVVQTESKLRESIMNLTKVASNGYKGFDILDKNGNYKSFYERMLGLSEIYEELQEQDKKLGNNSATALIELIAGEQICLKFMETYIYRTHLIALIA